jgi:hypothetical protein
MTSDAEFGPDFVATGWERYSDYIQSWLENDVRNQVLFIPVPRVVDRLCTPYVEHDVIRLSRGLIQAPCPWTDNPAVYRWWVAMDDATGTIVATSSAFRLDAGDYWTRVAQAYGADVLTWPLELRRANYRELRRRYRRTTRVALNWRRTRGES